MAASRSQTCARCGDPLERRSALPWCTRCGPSQRWSAEYDPPQDYLDYGTRRAPTPSSDWVGAQPPEQEDVLDAYPDEDLEDYGP